MDPELRALIQSFDAGLPLSEAETPPGAWYTDPRLYALERERLFLREWQAVGHLGQVASPGQFFAVDIAGEPVVVVRGDDGVLRAFSNVCRHRGATIAEGEGCARSLRCPYHGWVYGLDGRLSGGPPEFEGVSDFERGKTALPPLRVDTYGPFIFVNLSPLGERAPCDAAQTVGASRMGGARTEKNDHSLLESLGDLPVRQHPETLLGRAFAERRIYVVECNWKVYIDNYLEAYHVPHVHPSLNAALDYGSYITEAYGPIVLQRTPTRDQPKRSGAGAEKDALVGTYAPPGSEARYWWAFPGFLLNVYENAMSGNYIRPLGVDRTLCVFDFFFTRPESVAENVAASDLIQQEDMAICRRVQAGLGSRSYRTGRYSVIRENGLHHFHRMLAETLQG